MSSLKWKGARFFLRHTFRTRTRPSSWLHDNKRELTPSLLCRFPPLNLTVWGSAATKIFGKVRHLLKPCLYLWTTLCRITNEGSAVELRFDGVVAEVHFLPKSSETLKTLSSNGVWPSQPGPSFGDEREERTIGGVCGPLLTCDICGRRLISFRLMVWGLRLLSRWHRRTPSRRVWAKSNTWAESHVTRWLAGSTLQFISHSAHCLQYSIIIVTSAGRASGGSFKLN